MQNGIRERGEAAGEWLKQHFADDPNPHVSIQWVEDEPQHGSYDRLLEILFAPRPDDLAA